MNKIVLLTQLKKSQFQGRLRLLVSFHLYIQIEIRKQVEFKDPIFIIFNVVSTVKVVSIFVNNILFL